MSRSPRRRFASPKSSLKLAVASTAALVCAAASQQASAGLWQGSGTSGSLSDKYHIEQAEGHKSVGQFVVQSDAGTSVGSGVLIHRKIVLTAAHVVDGATDLTFRVGNEYKKATKWVVHKNYTGDVANGSDDIAIVLLESNMKNVKTSKIRRNANVVGKKVTYSGYGTYGSADGLQYFPDGQRRAGVNIVDGYWTNDFVDGISPGFLGTLGEFGTKNQFYTEFETPLNLRTAGDDFTDLPIANEYTSSGGDSGGAVFTGNYLAGLVSWGTASTFGDYAFNTNVAMYKRWIDFYVKRIHAGIRTGSSFYSPNNPYFSALTLAAAEGDGNAAKILALGRTASVVPEPAGLAALALGGLAMRRRRRA